MEGTGLPVCKGGRILPWTHSLEPLWPAEGPRYLSFPVVDPGKTWRQVERAGGGGRGDPLGGVLTTLCISDLQSTPCLSLSHGQSSLGGYGLSNPWLLPQAPGGGGGCPGPLVRRPDRDRWECQARTSALGTLCMQTVDSRGLTVGPEVRRKPPPSGSPQLCEQMFCHSRRPSGREDSWPNLTPVLATVVQDLTPEP